MALFNDPGAGRPRPGLEMGGGGGWASGGSRAACPASAGRPPPGPGCPCPALAQPGGPGHPRGPVQLPLSCLRAPSLPTAPQAPRPSAGGWELQPSPGRPGGLRKPGPPRGTPGRAQRALRWDAALPCLGPRDLEPQGWGGGVGVGEAGPGLGGGSSARAGCPRKGRSVFPL